MDTANYEFSRLLDCVLKNAQEMDNAKMEMPNGIHPVKIMQVETFVYFIEMLIRHYKELGLYIEKDEAENGVNNETRGWFKTGYREI
jgi:hypothetical protein